ncbi:MAG: alanine--glyoxylate aminotransferase family protein [Propionibacteriaceae bacterium]|jgi:alanine-glyoxylate transaminase/serine-glyoxylate transaminase/serine-pyruvate transaminase|nr:alanine--glyoxylate aminotransferase family protein [Propionibacteriaceae bacterium]
MPNTLDRVPATLLLGAGPSGVAPSTYHALAKNTVGHMDPFFIGLMDELKQGLRTLFGTANELTVPLSGTGSAGMEAAFVNLVEPGDKVLVLQNGVFGKRMVEVAGRLGAEVTELGFEWGTPVDVAAVADQLRQGPYKIVAIVFAETSTGVRNPVAEVGELLRGTGALYLVDAVTAIGGIPVEVDRWGIDVCYAGSQKCLSCPPGASPITFSERAVAAIKARATKVPNWYLDMTLLTAYWGGGTRVYHHTPPINMMYGLYQAVYNILQEGVENVFARHLRAHQRLAAGLAELGWEFLVDEPYRLPELNTVKVPEGVDEARLRARLLAEHQIEINGGLGALAGKIVRIGLMGYNATEANADRLIGAMKAVLAG